MQDLAQWRRKCGWRQVDLARMLEVDVSTIKRWERGETHPYPYHLERLGHMGFDQGTLASAETETSSSGQSEEQTGKSAMEPDNQKHVEHPSTYFVQDRSNQSELDRLRFQDQMITA